jgi:hypothetical protein
MQPYTLTLGGWQLSCMLSNILLQRVRVHQMVCGGNSYACSAAQHAAFPLLVLSFGMMDSMS